MFEPISAYGNYFVGVDGEGVGNDYVLLDSSLVDYPRLYTGARLTTQECLDWLWGLGAHAGYCKFVLYGAGYDFNNWLRDIPPDDVKRLANSQPVRYGNYMILWRQRFVFELRKIRAEDTTKDEYAAERYKYKSIKTRLGDDRVDYIGLQFWDALPFWQTSFVKALEKTLGSRTIEPELIEAGKEARGSFTHENIEWVSKYNKAECHNLAYMMCELDSWFKQAGITPMHYNGPGSAAKAMLRTYQPFLHAGRRISRKSRSASKMVHEYVFPGADDARHMMHRTMSAYAGGLNRQLMIGYHPGECWQYDRISAYPYAMLNLPCLSHGRWQRTRKFDPASFALWKVRYKATHVMPLYPFFWRLPDGSIEYPYAFDERWAHTAEVRAALAVDPAGVVISDGWKWIPDVCDNPYPFWWVAKAFALRQHYKSVGNEGASIAIKLPLNSLYGSIAQARGGTVARPPWTQQLLWAGAITAFSRASLYLAHRLAPESTIHLATDGIISSSPLPLKIGDKLGDWEVTRLRDLTCVQYGVYMGTEILPDGTEKPRHRERGFRLTDDEVAGFTQEVHNMWKTGHWSSHELQQKLFVTCGLVAIGQKQYDEWCTWQDMTKLIELDQASVFKIGHVNGMPGLWPIRDASYNLDRLGKSSVYEPKWGKGEDFPIEWKIADEVERALEIAV